jgi:hypothetical protein
MNGWTRSPRIPTPLHRWINFVAAALQHWSQRSRRLHAACLALSQVRRRRPVLLGLEMLENRELLSANLDPLATSQGSLAQPHGDAVALVNASQPSLTAVENQYGQALNALTTAWEQRVQTFVQAEFAALNAVQQAFDTLVQDADNLLTDLGIRPAEQPSASPPPATNNSETSQPAPAGGDPISTSATNSSSGQATIKPMISSSGITVQFQSSPFRTGEGLTAEIPVTLAPHPAGAGDQQVTVYYATSDGTAVAGRDYQATSGTLTFPIDVGTEYIALNTLNDNSVNQPSPETLTLTLSNPSGATLGSPSTEEVDIQTGSDSNSNLPPVMATDACPDDG